MSQTIAAIATAAGRGGVGIVRVSGKNLLPFARALCGKTPQPRTALHTDFLDENGEALDNGLLLYFPAPASFTGEDILELHGHGGTVVMQMLLARCLALGARVARPGEFSQRAFLNGKLDLAQAESVADLIDADSRAAARMAVRSLKGAFSQHIRSLADGLVHVRMLVEAALDFPEEDIDFLAELDIAAQVADLRARVAAVRAQAAQGAMLREGVQVVLAGAPNVGKSSLLNALAGEEVAIVTDIAGTTRDTVREQITLDGIPVRITDTAGLRETGDRVEQIGIGRSRQALAQADIALVLIDPQEGINDTLALTLHQLPPELVRVEIRNKCDLRGEAPFVADGSGSVCGAAAVVGLSAKTGAGLDLLKHTLLRQIGWQGQSEGLFLARSRHLDALARADDELAHAAALAGAGANAELLAEHLRLAQNACNEITGEFTADDLLGVIFSRFCIGK
ncbi:tRNA uridine-5-carboxymethylaminomethyl(34) synthesis GTPase MnmE [Conchiformibius kuhniae]|uniref:tRNA modification GTPase MnmE n=1 Tax=Conchiformibius kuhniae TaxID=211502 RepID=A0ABD8B6Y6_9NEIS|nr:tRNA uridine-5-carboxymethylaminomethyl(34) synthesis GTPase MnmE [Conchiformibius kuhniae]